MEQETSNQVPSEVQKFFKALSEDRSVREDFYGKFKSLEPKNWTGFVQLGKERGYDFTVDDLKGMMGDEFYTGNRAAWRDSTEASTDSDGTASVPVIEGTWIWADHPGKKIVFAREQYSIYENDVEEEKGKYSLSDEILIECTASFLVNSERRATYAKVGRFVGDTMTMDMEGVVKKYKRWLGGRRADTQLNNSLIGAWLDINAIDESVQLVFTNDTLKLTVDEDKITTDMMFPNIAIHYKVKSLGHILELKSDKITSDWNLKLLATDSMTISQDSHEVTLKK